jgi:hypothetical protein
MIPAAFGEDGDSRFPFFSEVFLMASKRSRSRRGRRFVTTVHKAHGVVQSRVQRVGPEHFGIVSVDCARARFKWMLRDFYGRILIPSTTVGHNRSERDFAVALVRVEADAAVSVEDGLEGAWHRRHRLGHLDPRPSHG